MAISSDLLRTEEVGILRRAGEGDCLVIVCHVKVSIHVVNKDAVHGTLAGHCTSELHELTVDVDGERERTERKNEVWIDR